MRKKALVILGRYFPVDGGRKEAKKYYLKEL